MEQDVEQEEVVEQEVLDEVVEPVEPVHDKPKVLIVGDMNNNTSAEILRLIQQYGFRGEAIMTEKPHDVEMPDLIPPETEVSSVRRRGLAGMPRSIFPALAMGGLLGGLPGGMPVQQRPPERKGPWNTLPVKERKKRKKKEKMVKASRKRNRK